MPRPFQLFMLTFVILTCLPMVPIQAEEPARQTVIKVSKETTRITEPLDADGYVDYLEAVNLLKSKGVTADTNFEVIVRQIFGQEDLREDLREEYFRRLGDSPPDIAGPMLKEMGQYFSVDQFSQDELTAFFNEVDRISKRPWTKKDSPRGAEWLEAMNDHLDTLAKGSRRPRNYVPYVASRINAEDQGPRLIAVLLPSVQQYRSIARALQIRAMYRVGTDDLDGAASDLMAIHRLARHSASGFSLIESLVGLAIDAIAFDGEKVLFASPRLTKTQARQYFKDHLALAPLPRMSERIDIGERYMGLDAVQSLARQNAKSVFEFLNLMRGLSQTDKPKPRVMLVADVNSTKQDSTKQDSEKQDPAKQDKTSGFAPDWNLVMANLNVSYDKLVDASSEPDPETRKRKFQKIDSDLKKLQARVKNPITFLAQSLISLNVSESLGYAIGDILTALLMPAIESAHLAEARGDTRLALARVALAAQLYRLEQGVFPEKLSDLQDKLFLETIPEDANSGQPLIYQATKESLLIYGVGQNGIDDNGSETDDIVIRLGAAQ